MATAKKAPAKRKAAKKPASRKPAVKKQAPVEETLVEVADPTYDPKWHGIVEAYTALKNAGAPIPKEIAEPVEKWLTEQAAAADALEAAQSAAAAAQAAEDDDGPKWIRNNFNGPFALRLDRQTEKRRIELKPRGQRGDIHPLEPGDENDRNLIASVETGLVSIITNGEAKRISTGQTTNIQQTHTPLSILKNAKGEPITAPVRTEVEYNQQGIVVGVVDQGAQQRIRDGEFGKARNPLGDLQRPQHEVTSTFVPTGGNPAIVHQGVGPQPMSKEARERLQDDLARRRGVQGRPEDVLGLSVEVTPTNAPSYPTS